MCYYQTGGKGNAPAIALLLLYLFYCLMMVKMYDRNM